MKKLMSLLLVLLMVMSVAVGCNKNDASNVSNSGNAEVADKTEELVKDAADAAGIEVKDVKIGVMIWSTDDGLGLDSKYAIDAAAKALDFEVVYKTGDFDAESQITACENLISAGCNGILICTMVDASTDELLKICEEAEVPLALMFRNIVDDATREYCFNSEYFVGYTVEDEEGAGADMVDKLVETGCKNFGLLFYNAGNIVTDRRQAGVYEHLAELEGTVNVVGEALIPNSASAADMVDAANTLLTAYPEMDAMIMTGGSNGGVDGVIALLKGTGVKLACFDTPADVADGFDSGVVVQVAVGAQIDPLFSVICLYNELQGMPLSDNTIENFSNYIYINSTEDAAQYDAYFDTFMTYTEDEIRNMSKVHNPDFTLEDLQKEVEDYTLQNVIGRVDAR